jgi:hypothetical protein
MDIEEAADPSGADLAPHPGVAAGGRTGIDHVELPELLVERHGGEQALDEIGHRKLRRY